jgi:ABC-type lipoprotein release transport system permease subunit
VVNVEKWSSFLLLGFIVIVASFNIISTMALLILEKSANASTLLALGASPRMIRQIYVVQGWMITLLGGLLGIIIGTMLSLGQQHYGWIRLNGSSEQLSIASYPVEFQPLDLIPIALLVALIGAVTALVASRSSKS